MHRSTLAAVLLLVSAAAQAEDAKPADDWRFAITPYVLLPGVDAELGVSGSGGGGGAPEIEYGPTDVATLINFAAMLKVEVNHGQGFVVIDWMYLDLGDTDSVVREIDFPDGSVPIAIGTVTDTAASFDGFMVAMAGGWHVYDDDRYELDAYGGLRTLNLSASFRWSFTTTVTSPGGAYTFPASGEIEDADATLDLMAGLRGRWDFGDGWQAIGLVDHGWGQGTQSWQWALGVSWRKDSTSLELAWREIGWSGLGDSGPGKLRLFGPALGATFRF